MSKDKNVQRDRCRRGRYIQRGQMSEEKKNIKVRQMFKGNKCPRDPYQTWKLSTPPFPPIILVSCLFSSYIKIKILNIMVTVIYAEVSFIKILCFLFLQSLLFTSFICHLLQHNAHSSLHKLSQNSRSQCTNKKQNK